MHAGARSYGNVSGTVCMRERSVVSQCSGCSCMYSALICALLQQLVELLSAALTSSCTDTLLYAVMSASSTLLACY
jgi:hypothetical protein